MPNNCKSPKMCLLSETCVPCAICPNAKEKANDRLARTPCSPVGFSPVAPVYEGGYYMRCMENDHEPEWVAIYWKDGILRASLDSLGDYDLRSIHEGLTDVTWRRAISIQEND